MDRLSTDIIKGVQSLTPEGREFVDYVEKTREEVEEALVRSPLSWEVLAEEALHFPRRLGHALERLNERISKLQTQGKEAEATIKSLRKLRPVPGTSEFSECEREAQVAELMLTAAKAMLLELQRARDSVPDVDLVREGVVRVLEVAFPHLAEGVRQTISIDAGSIRSLVVRIDGKLSAFEALVSAAEDQTGRKLECPTFHRDLLDQLKLEELVELRG